MEFWYGLYGMQSPRVYPRSWTRMYQEVVDHAARAEDARVADAFGYVFGIEQNIRRIHPAARRQRWIPCRAAAGKISGILRINTHTPTLGLPKKFR